MLNVKVYSHDANLPVLNKIEKSDLNILDVGCGAGQNAAQLFSIGKIVDGITISPQEAKEGKHYFRNIFIQNLEHGLPEEVKEQNYDVVLCSHVLEHIAYPEKLLEDILNLTLKNGAKLIIALPNFLHYNNRFKIFKGNFDYTESGLMDNTHVRWYTFKSAQELFQKRGLKVISAEVDGNLPFYSITKYLPFLVQKMIKKILFKISPGFFGYQIILICESKG